MKKGLLITLIITVIIGGGLFFSYTGANNKEIKLRKNVEAQQDVCKSNFDKMFKTIAKMAQVPTKFMEDAKEAFKEIYPSLIAGRYDNSRGGALMSWVHEQNPQFDMKATGKLYENLQIAIESNQQEFFYEQKKLIDYKREHSTFINMWWNSNVWKLSSRGDVEITTITSDKTEDVYKTGKDNDLKVF